MALDALKDTEQLSKLLLIFQHCIRKYETEERTVAALVKLTPLPLTNKCSLQGSVSHL